MSFKFINYLNLIFNEYRTSLLLQIIINHVLFYSTFLNYSFRYLIHNLKVYFSRKYLNMNYYSLLVIATTNVPEATKHLEKVQKTDYTILFMAALIGAGCLSYGLDKAFNLIIFPQVTVTVTEKPLYSTTYKRPTWEWRKLIDADVPEGHDIFVKTKEGAMYTWDSRITLKEFADYFVVKNPESLDPATPYPVLDLLCIEINTYAEKTFEEWHKLCKGVLPTISQNEEALRYAFDAIITQQQYLDYIQSGMFVFL